MRVKGYNFVVILYNLTNIFIINLIVYCMAIIYLLFGFNNFNKIGSYILKFNFNIEKGYINSIAKSSFVINIFGDK